MTTPRGKSTPEASPRSQSQRPASMPMSARSTRLAGASMVEQSSEYRQHFKENQNCYASMSKKPLTPYHPNAFRSRLMEPSFKPPMKNESSIVFDSGMHYCHKRRFTTTHKANYLGGPIDVCTNQGILSNRYVIQRDAQQK
ncbi:unnamed protein product [Prorocentrum cordatum]|uniref:Uncharacterized protein n=1 Tax=Prorocentrum cordatum TaxID=2364126 RepID=A0ABN9VIH4_9DINO|nr:unnamed protein product [Polarella glacialis]|mmetsp:Transcript_71289/g.185889  ORF Transcript_71289/g.185889 Transcript_71289/m.185889 type:complete len:141 (-) Transcript_71289:117-539(-)